MDLSPAALPKSTVSAAAVDSSPSPSPPAPKLRLMCSYWGRIVPRPADKTLCYAGGETRIVAIDRRSAFSLSFLTSHLSKSLFNGRPFCLKYQLPNHDLDSLISIATDEDLANMIDKYDRLAAAGGSASRLRFFLFPARSSASDSTDEVWWFIDALRNAGVVAEVRSSDTDSDGKVVAPTVVGVSGGSGGGAVVDFGTSLPESIVLEKNSSFESTSSSASTSNSPAIRRGGGGGSEEGIGVGLHDFKVILPAVDSIGSDNSLASPNFSPQAIVYQDAPGFVESKAVSANHFETESDASYCSPHSDMLTPVQVPGYVLTKPKDPSPPPQPQYVHLAPQSHYITQYYTNQVPVASYPMMYHQPYAQPQQPVQYQMNEPYPVYMMPSGRTQNLYDMPTHQRTPEYGANVYRTPAVATQPVNVPSNDYSPQVVAFPPVNQPSQLVAPPHENTNYISEYEDSMHAQIYKTQPLGPTLPSHQLQTPANATTAMLSKAFTQLHVDNKH